ncbi:MAG: hypothetical protein ABSH46_03230 [Bryobacteraceae bacterium]
MTAVSGSRSLQSGLDIPIQAGGEKRCGVLLPSLLVEIRRKEPTRFIEQQRVHSNGNLAREVRSNHVVGEREELPSVSVDSLPVLLLRRIVCLPVPFRLGAVPISAVRAFPADCVHIFATAKELSKQLDLLIGRQCRSVLGHGRLCGRTRVGRNLNAKLFKQLPEAPILAAKTS